MQKSQLLSLGKRTRSDLRRVGPVLGDPDIDLERDYVEKTLTATGLVAEVSHFFPDNPLKEAKTATGGTFHSNGQVLVLKLADSSEDVAAPK